MRVQWTSSPARRTMPSSGTISTSPKLSTDVAGVVGAGPPQQGPDAGRQLLGHERLGDVVVGPGLEAGHHVVGVGAGRDHDDGNRAVRRSCRQHSKPSMPGSMRSMSTTSAGCSAKRSTRLLAAGRPRRPRSPRPRGPAASTSGSARRPPRAGCGSCRRSSARPPCHLGPAAATGRRCRRSGVEPDLGGPDRRR